MCVYVCAYPRYKRWVILLFCDTDYLAIMQIRVGDEYSIDNLTFSGREKRKGAWQRKRQRKEGGERTLKNIYSSRANKRERIKANEYKRATINEKHKTRVK